MSAPIEIAGTRQERGLLYNTDTMKESGATGRVDGPVLERRVDRSVLLVATEPAANTRSAPTLQVSHVAITSPPFLIMYDPNLGTMFCCLVKKKTKGRVRQRQLGFAHRHHKICSRLRKGFK